MKSTKERIAIIFWRWRSFQKNDSIPIMDKTFWNNTDNLKLLETPELAFDYELADKYEVFFKNMDKEKIENPSAWVVRSYIENCENGLTFLKKMVQYFEKVNREIFVFLHRGEGFKVDDVTAVLKKTEAAKCFLFGGGRDYIYYATQSEGLLGENGKFFSQRTYTENGQKYPAIHVANDKKKRIFQPHFDKVWEYYKHEFDIKTFELREDLLSFLLPIFEDRVPDNGELKTLLEKEYGLFLRVKNFIGLPRTKKEKIAFKKLEESREKSYSFDDLKENLNRKNNGNLEVLNDIQQHLQSLFFRDVLNTETIQTHCLELQKKFNELIKIIKQ